MALGEVKRMDKIIDVPVNVYERDKRRSSAFLDFINVFPEGQTILTNMWLCCQEEKIVCKDDEIGECFSKGHILKQLKIVVEVESSSNERTLIYTSLIKVKGSPLNIEVRKELNEGGKKP